MILWIWLGTLVTFEWGKTPPSCHKAGSTPFLLLFGFVFVIVITYLLVCSCVLINLIMHTKWGNTPRHPTLLHTRHIGHLGATVYIAKHRQLRKYYYLRFDLISTWPWSRCPKGLQKTPYNSGAPALTSLQCAVGWDLYDLVNKESEHIYILWKLFMKLTRNWTPDPSVLSAKRSHGSQLSIWRWQITWSLGVKYHFYWAVWKTHSATIEICARYNVKKVWRSEQENMAYKKRRRWCQNSSKSLWTTL